MINVFGAHCLGIAFLLTCYLPARVEEEGDDDQTCYASPTWSVFKLVCVAKMGTHGPYDKPLVEGGSCVPLLSWFASFVICGSRWILTVLLVVWVTARLGHCFTLSLLDFVLPCTCSTLPTVWYTALNSHLMFMKHVKSSMQALVAP